LVLHGEQGSAKTTAGRMLRGLIDPNVSPLRTQPRDEGDLLIAASGGLDPSVMTPAELVRFDELLGLMKVLP
jgi:hypothetical protein